MPFDPLSWAIGFILNNALKKSAEALRERKKLSDKLEQVVKFWAVKLPAELGLHPDTLFGKLPITAAGDVATVDLAPAASKLGTSLANGIIPSSQLWHDALVERWTAVYQQLGSNAVPFFHLNNKEDAKTHLKLLAEQLARACQEDPSLFQVTVLSRLDAQQTGVTITGDLRIHLVDSNIEAVKYAPNQAYIRFTLSNLTPNQVKITGIRLSVLKRTPSRCFRLQGVGAPLKEFELQANLSQADEHDLLTTVNVQFVLKPGETEAFSIEALGDEGYEYQVVISCKADNLSFPFVYEVTSEQVAILYPIRTIKGLSQHDKRSS